MGGNIGTAILDLAPPAKDRVHVIEMSSFQIELTPSLAPSVGVLLNISPDHLDRHGTMEHYAAPQGAPRRRMPAHPVIGEDDDWCRDIAERLRLANRGWVDLVSARVARARTAGTRWAASSSPARPGPARSAPSPTSPASARCAAGTTSRTRWPPALRRMILGVRPARWPPR